MNILILSSGTRNKIIEYFKFNLMSDKENNGAIIATDMSKLAPSIYIADKFYQVPSISDPNYLNIILEICKKEHVRGVLSLIDPELSLLSKNREKFNSVGTIVIGSSYDLCELSMDKMKMYEWLVEHGYKTAKSYSNKEDFYADYEAGIINYPVFVKPINGSASISISKVYDKETIEFLFKQSDDLMIQEYLNGQEIGADVYIDMISREVVSIFTKKKISMRAGETEKSVSFKDNKLFNLIEKFILDAGFVGQIDIDIFDIDGEYYISEVNPRFGGGYPHAYECGCNHMKMIINNLKNKKNEKIIGQYDEGVYMMKYNDLVIRNNI